MLANVSCDLGLQMGVEGGIGNALPEVSFIRGRGRDPEWEHVCGSKSVGLKA
jgi:hypothetical protein